MFNLSSKEVKFFDYFDEFSLIINEATDKLKNFTEDTKNLEVKFREIEEVEHRGDKLFHDIMEALNKTYITPIDRQDIYTIVKGLDDIVDSVKKASSRYVMYNITETTKNAKVVAGLIAMCGQEVISLMKEFRNMKNNKKLSASIIELYKLEDRGDSDFRVAIRELYTSNVHEIEIIKWREIYGCLEQTLDACKDLAGIIEGIAMKYA